MHIFTDESAMRLSLFLIFFFMTGFAYFQITDSAMIDGVAAASTLKTSNKLPNLKLTSNLALKNNTIHVMENQNIIINVSSSTSSAINVGIYQNNQYYYDDTSGLILPEGASFKANLNDTSKATFSWTPPKGYASKKSQEQIKFFAYDLATTNSTSQLITIIIDPDNTPVFDSNLQTTWSINAGQSLSIPLIVLKDSSTANIVISSGNLPRGATFSKLRKNSNGDWITELNWQPTINQLGVHNITLVVKHNIANAMQSTLDLQVQVIDVVASTFIEIPKHQQSASIGKILSFKFGFTLDPHSSKPVITMTPNLSKATLSKPQKSNNIWYSTFSWKPTAAEIGKRLS